MPSQSFQNSQTLGQFFYPLYMLLRLTLHYVDPMATQIIVSSQLYVELFEP
jgi:hypothetical protein